METTEIIRMLRQCGDCCRSSCEECPDYQKAEEGFRKDPEARGFMWNCGGVLLDAADRLELLNKRWKRTVVERDQARQMRERAERLLRESWGAEKQPTDELLGKVIKTWECCLAEHDHCDLGCPYWGESEGSNETACYMRDWDTLKLLRNVEPVVHAHWDSQNRCSNCCVPAISHDIDEEVEAIYLTKRCPECGAHMDEEVSE